MPLYRQTKKFFTALLRLDTVTGIQPEPGFPSRRIEIARGLFLCLKMTPDKMLDKFGDNHEPRFEVRDNVVTPGGLAKINGVFTRGLSWWYETDKGTYQAKTVDLLNPK